jgi:hypothetical protein
MYRWCTKLAALIALITIMPAIISAAAFNLDSLLVQSVGGPAAVDSLKAMPTFEATGTVTLNALEGTFDEVYAAPTNFYLKMDFGAFSLSQSYDGTTARQQDHTGKVSVLTGYERREVLKSIYLESFSFIVPGRVPGTTEYLGLVTGPDSGWYYGANFIVDGLDTLTAYFDTTTALRKFVVTRMDNARVITTLSDYRDVHGIQVPFTSVSEAPAIPISSEVRIDWFNPDVAVAPELFAMSDEQSAFRFPENADSVVIPIDYTDGRIRMVATIGGSRRAYFILDTGSSATILDRKFAAGLELKGAGELPAKGIGGYETINLYEADSVEIGGLVLYDMIVGSLDLSELATTDDSLTFGGLIGYDFLSRFPILIDYGRQTATVYSPVDFTPAPGGIATDMQLTLLAPTIQASIDGVSGEFLIDLGNSLGLMLHDSFVRKYRVDSLLSDITQSSYLIGGVGGEVGGESGLADSLRIGDIRIDSLRVLIPQSSGGLSGSEELAGNIGNKVLEHFRLLLDYGSRQVVFYPASTEP